MTVCRG